MIIGTNGSDFINGRGGNDVICGLDGHDTLIGGLGNDRIDGGPGEDECITDPQDSVENCEFGDNNRGEGLSAESRDDIRDRFDDAVERLGDLGR